MSCANALFYSTESVTVGEAVMIGVISSLIVAPPVAIFAYVFKKAGAYRAQVANENDAADAPNWLQKESLGSSLRILEKAVRANKSKRAKKEKANAEDLGLTTDTSGGRGDEDSEDSGDEYAGVENAIKIFPYVGIAYVGAHFFCLFCSMLILIYGIKFRGETSDAWLLSSFISSGQDLVVNEPLKVLIRALRLLLVASLDPLVDALGANDAY